VFAGCFAAEPLPKLLSTLKGFRFVQTPRSRSRPQTQLSAAHAILTGRSGTQKTHFGIPSLLILGLTVSFYGIGSVFEGNSVFSVLCSFVNPFHTRLSYYVMSKDSAKQP
jgi:hypothetical protein